MFICDVITHFTQLTNAVLKDAMAFLSANAYFFSEANAAIAAGVELQGVGFNGTFM